MKIYFISLALFFVLVFTSCEKTEKVDNFPKHTSKLVTNCFFSPDTAFVFKLSKSLSPIDNAPFKNQNSKSAYIRVFENNILFDSFRVNNATTPSYNGSKYPSANNTYRFECFYPGLGIVSGEDFLPDTIAFRQANGFYSIRHAYETNDTMITGEFTTNLNLDFNFVKTENQYLIITITGTFINKPILIGGNGYYVYSPSVELYNVQDLNSSNQTDYINSQIFTSNSNGIKKLNLKWDNPFSPLRKSGPSYDYTITVTACSSAAFEYLKRQSLQIENNNDPFSQPTPISNNIINGYGIFGGINSTQYKISF